MTVSSKSVYTAYQVEAVNGVVEKPNKFIPEMENSVNKQVENIKSMSRFGVLNNNLYLAPGTDKVAGNINVEIDTTHAMIWFLLALGQYSSADISSLTDWSVYKHTLSDYVCAYKSLSVENKKGGCIVAGDGQDVIVQRAYGCVVDSLKLSAEANKLVTIENAVKGQGMFDVAFLNANEKAEASTVSITSATPTSGVLRVVATSHGLALNDLVKIAWNSVSGYNGYWKVVEVVDANTIDVNCDVTGSAGTGGDINQISMRYFGEKEVKGLLSGDTVKFFEETTETYEDAVVRYVDEDNDVVGFDSVTSILFTVANKTKIELLAQTATTNDIDFFAFSNITIRQGTSYSNALASSPLDFETVGLEFIKAVTDIIQNRKNVSTPTGLEINIEIDRAFEDKSLRDIQRKAEGVWFIVDLELPKIVSSTDTNNAKYSMRIIMPNVVYETHEITDANNDIIKEKLMWVAIHDLDEGYSCQIEVINDKEGTFYTG